MELAHTHAGVLRIIGKAVLLGLLVIVLAKVIFAILALAVVGLLIFLCARALYVRRAFLRRILLWTNDAILPAAAKIGVLAGVTVAAGSWFIFRALCLVLQLILGAWSVVGYVFKALMLLLLSLLFYGGRIGAKVARLVTRGGVTAIQVVRVAIVSIRNQSAVICGTLLEAASGALVVAMLLNLTSVHGLIFLPDVEQLDARIGGAALLGALLGVTLGLSRISWVKEAPANQAAQNQN
jgi:hypothetical protein